MTDEALSQGNRACALRWYHEAAGCFHGGQYFFYLDDDLTSRSLAKVWELYSKVIALHEGRGRPIRADIPFRGRTISAY